jgi:drug/metabolite transporter (DMT)-like permease
MSQARAGLIIYAKLVTCMALWGGTWVSGRVIAQAMQPLSAAFLRFLFATAFLYLARCRAERRWPRFPRAQWKGVLFLALTGVFFYNYFFFSGLAHIQAGRAALLVACVPSTVALYSALVLRARITALKAFGIALSLFGVAVILSDGEPLKLLRQGVSLGDVYILGCVLFWAAYSLAGAQVMRQITSLSAVTWSCALGTLLLLLPALAGGMAAEIVSASALVWTNLAYLGIAATGLAYTWYYDGILALGAPRASVFINLVPVFATLMSTAILGEDLGLALALGGAMVVSGVVLANRPA